MTSAATLLLPAALAWWLLGRVYAPAGPQPPRASDHAALRAVIAGIALHQLVVVVAVLALGHAGWLRPSALAGVLAGVGLLAAGTSRRPAPLPRVWARALRTRRGRVLLALIAAAAAVALPWVLLDVVAGTTHADAMIYHAPRVQRWLADGSFAPWPTPVWQQLGLPVASDAYLGLATLLGGGWPGATLGCALLTLGAALCVYLAGRQIGLSSWRAGCAAALFVAFPAVGQRAGAWSSDMAAAFPMMAGFVLWQQPHRPPQDSGAHSAGDGWPGLATFVALGGLAVACKATVASTAALLLGAGLWLRRTRASTLLPSERARRLAGGALRGATVGGSLALGLGLVAASYAPVQRLFGAPWGGPRGRALTSRDAGIVGAIDSVLFNLLQWLLEPLAYVPRRLRDALMTREGLHIGRLLPLLGIADRPAHYPSGNPDMTRTGALPLLLAPLVAARLPAAAQLPALALQAGGFVALYAPLSAGVHTSRFGVALLGGYALMWCAPRAFDRGRARWLLAGIVAVTAAATIFTSLRWAGRDLFDGGDVAAKGEPPRAVIQRARASLSPGEPLLLLTAIDNSSRDGRFARADTRAGRPPLRYVLCPRNGERWVDVFRRAATRSSRLFVLHGGRGQLVVGPDYSAPLRPTRCDVAPAEITAAARAAGWRRVVADKRWLLLGR